MSHDEVDHEIPAARLPPGFASSLDEPVDEPAPPRPAATVVLLRPGPTDAPGLEVLLLRRSRSVGFVPGAYVFPGGRVDRSDADPRVLPRLVGFDPVDLAHRMEQAEEEVPAIAYLVAALRETFEETGILAGLPPRSGRSAEIVRLREELLADRIPFFRILESLDASPVASDAAYIAHWVTPEVEPRRYDTRFFALRVPRGLEVRPQPGEISSAEWLSPQAALSRHARGRFPMVFPTLHTLRELSSFSSPEQVLDHYRARRIRRILPRLVRTPSGVGIKIPTPSD
jgi:8-oxo-dGTP pyrophosphatase MutT (NUDIX family)